MKKSELEKTHELVDFIRYDVLRFYTDVPPPVALGGRICAGCPLRVSRATPTSSCAQSGCTPREVWVPKEHAAIIKIGYRKEP